MKLEDLPLLNEAGGRSCPVHNCGSVPSVALGTPVCHTCIVQILDGNRATDATARAFIDKFKAGVSGDAEFDRQKKKIMAHVQDASEVSQTQAETLDSY